MAASGQGLVRRLAERFPPELTFGAGLAIAAVLAAATLGLRGLLILTLGDSYPYPTFMLGVGLAALLGGLRSALCAAVLLLGLGWLLFGSAFASGLDGGSAPVHLTTAAVAVGAIVLLRQLAVQVRRERTAADAALRQLAAAQEHSRRFVDLTPHIAWTADAEGRLTQLPKKLKTLTGAPDDELTGRGWQALVHPDDLAQVQAAWERAIASGEPYVAEFRGMRADGAYVWMRSQAYADRDDQGRIRRWYGLSENIDARKEAERDRELLLREVDHRARNILAVLQGLVSLMPKDDPQAFAANFRARLTALAGAHTLLAEGRWRGVELRALLEEELQAYDLKRVHLEGPPLLVRPERVQHLSMVVHELATNSAKYGALSVPDGRLRVEWDPLDSGAVMIEWAETGGPPSQAPTRSGFGSTLIQSLIGRREGESIMYDWRPEGLCFSMVLADLAATPPGAPPLQGRGSAEGRA
jgi:PAS domain S-box-containing protein